MGRIFCTCIAIAGLCCLLAGCGRSNTSSSATELQSIERKLDDALGRLRRLETDWTTETANSKRLDEILERISRAGIGPDAELAAVVANLDSSDFQQAYDALLAAMRIAPGDERVFQTSLQFIEAAARADRDDSTPLALDMHQRAGSLIPFLPLTKISDARSKHTALSDQLFHAENSDEGDYPFTDAERLLTAAAQEHLPAVARARLLAEVDAELDAQARRFGNSSFDTGQTQDFWAQWKAMKARYEDVQRAVLASLYEQDCKPRLVAWSRKADAFMKDQSNGPSDQIHETNETILLLLSEGQRMSRDMASYVEAEIEAAVRDERDGIPHKQLTLLAQLREWNYNRWVLERIEKVEQSGGTALDKLRSLSVIDDSRLAPFVGQRFAALWKLIFDACSKNDQVEATKLRVLRGFQL